MEELKQYLESSLESWNLPGRLSSLIVFILLVAVAVLLIYLSIIITRFILKRIIKPIFDKRLGEWSELLLKNKFYYAIGYLVSVIMLKAIVPALFEDYPRAYDFINKAVDSYLVYVLIRFIVVIIRTVEDKLNLSKIYENKPIAGYFQLARLVLYIIGFILIISILLSKSPIYLLGAFGAMTAIIMLIFKDTILGVVASIQISTNDMVRVGDWVEMSKYNADGDVLGINLNTVKIQNWDKTISTVPTYYFITESFKNWRGMQESGGRRIKRSLRIHIDSIRFVDKEMRERFEKIELISDYIHSKQQEIDEYNKGNDVDTAVLVNGRRMTNVGVFRIYIDKYLRNHPGVNQDMSLMVRLLEPDENGLPMEIYCFANDVRWAYYEATQSDIFDHVLASAAHFGLTIFQSPSGRDINKWGIPDK